MEIFFNLSVFPSGKRQIISYSSNKKYDVLYSLMDSIAPIKVYIKLSRTHFFKH